MIKQSLQQDYNIMYHRGKILAIIFFIIMAMLSLLLLPIINSMNTSKIQESKNIEQKILHTMKEVEFLEKIAKLHDLNKITNANKLETSKAINFNEEYVKMLFKSFNSNEKMNVEIAITPLKCDDIFDFIHSNNFSCNIINIKKTASTKPNIPIIIDSYLRNNLPGFLFIKNVSEVKTVDSNSINFTSEITYNWIYFN